MRRRKPGAGLVAVALCLGGALTACGGGDGEGYAAVGAGPSPKGAVAPSGVVTLVPLESPSASGTTSSTSSPSPAAPGTRGTPGASSTGPDGASPGPSGSPGTSETSGTPGSSRTDTSTGSGPGTGASATPTSAPGRGGSGAGSGTATPPRTPSATPRPPVPGTGTPSPTPTTPPGPAVLTVSAPGLADGDRRWCQRVTVTFRNTGGSAATSGTAGFSTHIIGLLGTDWGTVDSRQPLPAPIAAGTARTQTYTVCVDSWRVPLGMRIDTRTVTAEWR
ncbi:hypothetical protein ACFTUC_24105 [Streptomyces sp. NPDC056944]|uniref:hypothetical protein n=1 Tax=Streptomyces sp. NPDC056944 TaxID=3345972 RepID=UPI003630F709